jgi:hypothetical protein
MQTEKPESPLDLMSEAEQSDQEQESHFNDEFQESYLENFDESEAIDHKMSLKESRKRPSPPQEMSMEENYAQRLQSPESKEYRQEYSPDNEPRQGSEQSPEPQSHSLSPKKFQEKTITDPKENDSPSIDKIKSILKKLFSFYSSFGNRLTSSKMNFSQFLKLATDACILDSPHINQQRLTLVFTRVNKVQSNLDYPKFVKVLHGIAQIKYKNGDTNDKFRSLLNRHILPLYETIYEETDMGTEDKILKSKITFPTLMLVHLKLGTLRGIYERYFKSEMTKNYMISDKQMFKLSRQDLLTFLREFELLPSLVNNSLANNFYHEVFHIDSWIDQMGSHAQSVHDLAKILAGGKGISFTFFKFVFLLIKLSLYVFSDPSNLPRPFRAIPFTNDEKFYLLLERMEVSQGFLEVCMTHIKKLSHPRLVLNGKEIAEMHKETNAFPNFEEFLEKSNNEDGPWMLIDFIKQDSQIEFADSQGLYAGLMGPKISRKKGTRGTSALRKKTKKKKKIVEDDPIPKYVLKFKDELFKLFSKYAVFRNKEPKLNNFKFIKLLQDAEIVKITSRLEKIQHSPNRKIKNSEHGKYTIFGNPSPNPNNPNPGQRSRYFVQFHLQKQTKSKSLFHFPLFPIDSCQSFQTDVIQEISTNFNNFSRESVPFP